MLLRARVALGRVRTPRFRIVFHPWSRTAGSDPVTALFLVSLELYGIPDHAWHRSSVEFLLSPFCEMENLASETRDMSDMSVFKVSAWTINPDVVPHSSELLLPAPDVMDVDADPDRAFLFALGLDRLPVRIHVAAWDDYRQPLPPPPPPPSGDGDAGSDSARCHPGGPSSTSSLRPTPRPERDTLLGGAAAVGTMPLRLRRPAAGSTSWGLTPCPT